jgi:hypothetical protein
MPQHWPTGSLKADFHKNIGKVIPAKMMSTELPHTLRYAFLLHSSGIGGAERSALELIEKLIQYGNIVNCYEIIKIVINDAGNVDIDERTKISNKYINVSPTFR